MSCQCGTTATGASGATNTDSVMGQTSSDSSAAGLTIGGKKICNRCLLFWIAVGFVVLLLLRRN